MITPAISVLSAVEGLIIANAAFKPWVVPLTCVILVGLFAIQRVVLSMALRPTELHENVFSSVLQIGSGEQLEAKVFNGDASVFRLLNYFVMPGRRTDLLFATQPFVLCIVEARSALCYCIEPDRAVNVPRSCANLSCLSANLSRTMTACHVGSPFWRKQPATLSRANSLSSVHRPLFLRMTAETSSSELFVGQKNGNGAVSAAFDGVVGCGVGIVSTVPLFRTSAYRHFRSRRTTAVVRCAKKRLTMSGVYLMLPSLTLDWPNVL